MKEKVKLVTTVIRRSLRSRGYKLLFGGSALVMFALLVLIPVWTIPGNSVGFQLSLFSVSDYLVLIFISLLYALFITMQVYTALFSKQRAQGMARGVGGGLGAAFAGVAGTAFCASCLAPIFAFLGIGFGGVLFVLEYRLYFIAAIALFMLAAIYLSAKRLHRVC